MRQNRERFSETEKPSRNLNLLWDYCDKSQQNCHYSVTRVISFPNKWTNGLW